RYRQVSDWSSVALLDWGCGCGRIARHFLESDVRPGRVVGVDIDPVSIAWCQKNLLGAEFHTTGLQPPLAFPNDSFDFIHGNSVFTHLDEANQDLWLAELGRLLKPKGIAVLTIHSKSALSYGSADSTFIADWTDKGIFFPGHNTTIDEVISDHTYYYNTFHTHQYVQSNWSIFLDILEIHEMVFGYQDVVILRKP
ncbi:MAG: class I SAM-dependent methyltransferase, partial [Methylococcales bacterium]